METRNKAALLDAYLQEQERLTFDWGICNCCHFVEGWIRIVEGREGDSLIPPLGTHYAVAREIARRGGLEKAVTDALERQPIAASLAHAGDVMLFEKTGGLQLLGLCVGRTAACKGMVGEEIVHLIASDAVCAWAVGRVA